MNKQKKITKIVIVAILLLVVIMLGYTFSKYAKSYTIPTSSTVAKWSFAGEVFNSKNSSTETTISLADTIKNSKIKENRIAPGTNGDFTIVIKKKISSSLNKIYFTGFDVLHKYQNLQCSSDLLYHILCL